MDELVEDETVAAVRTRGPLPLPLEGWDQASIWGWTRPPAACTRTCGLTPATQSSH